MSKKPRKPLDDALAQQFVYGQDPQVAEEPSPPDSTSPPPKSNLMTQLQVASKEPTIRLTVDLSESMHRKLSLLAAKTGRKKADIVRVLLDEALKDVES